MKEKFFKNKIKQIIKKTPEIDDYYSYLKAMKYMNRKKNYLKKISQTLIIIIIMKKILILMLIYNYI